MQPRNLWIILPLLLLLVFLLIDVDVDDLVHTILFGFLVSLSRCHTGASVLSPGGLEGNPGSTHALCLPCADVSLCRVCALCGIPLSSWLHWFSVLILPVSLYAATPLAVPHPSRMPQHRFNQ